MSLIKFERVVSISSEDPAFPADNLLKSNYSDKKWKCKNPGEKQISVVLQMDSSVMINAIDIGNYGSAFIEIFVGKSSTPDDFKVLVVASSLMTLQEAKLGENMSNVRFFKDDSLAKPVSLEKWDRIKLVCSQPYNKYIQYGLSFVVVHGKHTSSSEKSSPILGNFRLKPKEEDCDISVGGLFAKRKQSPVAELKGAAAIRAASTSGNISKKPSKLLALCRNATSVQKENEESKEQIPQAKNTTSENVTSSVLRKDNTKKPKPDKPSTPKGIPRAACNGFPVQSSSSFVNGLATKRTTGNNDEKPKKKIIPKKRPEKPFNQLMAGVVFAISGFQNPYRSDLRSKALAMGAKYKADWDNSCSHLLCAFPNTPKFNQVLGQGKIITKEWVESCYSRRMRLPWRRFALHHPDKNLPESEEEIFEYVPRQPSPVDNRRRVSPGPVSSGEDTEEEIERVRMLQSKAKKDDLQVSNSSKKDVNDETTSNSVNVNLKKDSNMTTESKGSCKNLSESERTEVSFSPKRTSTKLFQKSKEKESGNTSTSQKKKNNSVAGNELRIEKENKLGAMQPLDEVKISLSDVNIIPGPSCKFVDMDIYEMDTDVEDESSLAKQHGLPPIYEFYADIQFFICRDIPSDERKKLERYIIAHKGSVVEKANMNVEIIISRSPLEVMMMKNLSQTARVLKPDWVWMCHDQNCLASTKKFEIDIKY